MSFFLVLVVGYLFGSVNSAYIICNIMGLSSPATFGSGNPGATNVFRAADRNKNRAAILTLSGDIFKGFTLSFLSLYLELSTTQTSFVILCVILGHIFPIFFRFRGGKGIATLCGAIFGFYWPVGIIFFIVWSTCILITKYSSLSGLAASIFSVISIIFIFNLKNFLPLSIIIIVIIFRHRSNIKHFLAGNERRF